MTRTRWFTVIDLTGSGLVLGDITSVKFRINVANLVSTGTYKLRHTTIFLNSWQTTLDATQADHESTNTNDEGNIAITSTGWKEWTVDKNHLNLNGKNWFRITLTAEGGAYKQIGIRTQNSASNKPYLRIETQEAAEDADLNNKLNPNLNGELN